MPAKEKMYFICKNQVHLFITALNVFYPENYDSVDYIFFSIFNYFKPLMHQFIQYRLYVFVALACYTLECGALK